MDTWAIGSAPVALAADDGRLWVTTRSTGAAHVGGTLTIAVSDSLFDYLDPARAYNFPAWAAFDRSTTD